MLKKKIEQDGFEPELLSALICDIYDTTLDRSLWPSVLKKVTGFVRGSAAAIFWNDAANNSGDIYFEDGGIAPYYRDIYFSKYVKLNPTMTPRLFAPAEVPMATADLIPYNEFLKSRLYREWALPQRLVDFVSIILEKSAAKSAMLGVFRNERQGQGDDEMRRRMRLLGPHIRRAVLIARVVDLKQAETTMLTQALDRFRAAMLFVDAAGRIVHANAAAHSLLTEGDIVRVAGGKLISKSPAKWRRSSGYRFRRLSG